MKKLVSFFLSFALLVTLLVTGTTTCSAAVPYEKADTEGVHYFYNTADGDAILQADINNDKVLEDIALNGRSIIINGKTIKTYKKGTSLYMDVVTLKNGTSYLDIITRYNGKNTCGLYQVKKNSLTKKVDFTSLMNKKLLTGNAFVGTKTKSDIMQVSDVDGNNIYLNGYLHTKSLGQLEVMELKLNYKDGKFTTSKGEIRAYAYNSAGNNCKFTAKKKLTIYKEAGSSKKAFTIKTGKKFTIVKAKIINKNIHVKVYYNGKYGWIKLSTSSKAFVKTKAANVNQ